MGFGIKKYLKKKWGMSQYVTVEECAANLLLLGKNILITGGATGIGFETAKQCVKQGANVIIASRNTNKLKTACNAIEDICVGGQEQ